MKCINTSSRDFQILKQKSGVPEVSLAAFVGDYLDKYDVYPELDEIPYVNSEPYLSEAINLKKNGTAKIQDILDYTNSSSIEEAIQYLNNSHSDLQIEILPIGEDALVKIQHMPSIYNINDKEEIPQAESLDSKVAIINIINKLQSLYGINIIETDSEGLSNLGINEAVKGAIIDGNIYINTDLATIDTQLHELIHLLVGGIRLKHPELYQQLVEQAQTFGNINEISSKYPNRTQLDLLEELLVTELSKYLYGIDNEISKLPETVQNSITKDFIRVLDAALMGNESVEIVINDLSKHTLLSLAKVVESRQFQDKFKGTIADSKITRKIANLKERLLKNNELVEDCV